MLTYRLLYIWLLIYSLAKIALTSARSITVRPRFRCIGEATTSGKACKDGKFIFHRSSSITLRIWGCQAGCLSEQEHSRGVHLNHGHTTDPLHHEIFLEYRCCCANTLRCLRATSTVSLIDRFMRFHVFPVYVTHPPLKSAAGVL